MMVLFEIVIRSSAVLMVGLLVTLLLRRHSAALRHWVLFVSLVCSVVAPAAAWVLPKWEAPLGVSTLMPPALAVTGSLTAVRPAAVAPPARSTTQLTDNVDRDATTAAMLQVWLFGAALSIATLLVGLFRLKRIDSNAAPVPSGSWRQAAARAGVDRSIQLRVSDRPGLLLVWGLRRPSIIVPPTALSWTPDRINLVLRHELAHITRRDWVVQIISEIVRAVSWFNPLVWFACARLRAECEVACDDLVVAGSGAGPEYAEHVVAIAQELKTQYWLPAPAIVRVSTLERRVRAMLDKTRNREPLSRRARGSAIALLAAMTLTIAAVAAQSFVSLSGTIVDPTQSVLPDVTLVLRNEQTQAKYEIKTDRTGRYEFVGLPPGSYTVEAALPGFAKFAGQVTVGAQNVQQDVTLTIGTIQETITVREGATQPPIDPESARKLEEIKQKRAQAVVNANKTPRGGASGPAVGGNIRVPLKFRDVRPQYPAAMRGTEGTVVLKAVIGTTGAVDEVEVVSSTHDEFSQSAIEAVRQWEFGATLLNGEPVATPMRVTVSYKTQ